MRVLVACEFSGIVRQAFEDHGHEAWSCDLLETEGNPAWHYQCDVRDVLDDGWDMLLAFPPCTYLCRSGAQWWPSRQAEQKEAIEFFMMLVNHETPMIAVENPIGLMSRLYRKPDQIIHPWWFGEGVTKATCLWLKNLPALYPTNIIEDPKPGVVNTGKADRWKKRSRTYKGVAEAMASQWGGDDDLRGARRAAARRMCMSHRPLCLHGVRGRVARPLGEEVAGRLT